MRECYVQRGGGGVTTVRAACRDVRVLLRALLRRCGSVETAWGLRCSSAGAAWGRRGTGVKASLGLSESSVRSRESGLLLRGGGLW